MSILTINPIFLEELSVIKYRVPLNIQLNTLYNIDAIDLLSSIESKSVDLVFTDEVYGVQKTRLNLKARKDITTDFNFEIEHENYPTVEDGKNNTLPSHLVIPWIRESQRVLKDNGFLVTFGFPEWATTFKDVCHYFGLEFKSTKMWVKSNTAPNFRHNNFTSAYECIFFASKGKTKNVWNFLEQYEMTNVVIENECPNCYTQFPINFSRKEKNPEWLYSLSPLTSGKSRVHPTQKPEWLITKLIKIMSNPGDIIVDPFFGSGVIPVVAKRMDRNYIGSDIDQKWFSHASEWLENTQEYII